MNETGSIFKTIQLQKLKVCQISWDSC